MLRLEVPVDQAEFAADVLWSEGASAVAEEARGGVVVLTADLVACPEALSRLAHEVLVDDGAWQDGWRPFARAVHAGPFVVRPPWVEADVADGLVELLIDAGRAFGTGAHPSTTLALEAMAAEVRAGDTVLDAGCGSGTLAVAAALLGATSVVAVDTDPAAVEATSANANLNGVDVEVRALAVEEVDGTFDVVVANLGSPLVHDLAPALLARTRRALVLSGMLGDHGARLATHPVVAHTARDGWTCAVLRP